MGFLKVSSRLPLLSWVKQGDPLLPFLFSLVADVFSSLMSKRIDCDLIKGSDANTQGPLVSRL